ncbi:galanin receptor type 1-like [Amphiura filiformis]|uniref:galanin receptor type 1-like n=1 Tax=Amphiura filiformis TaxID=82378 RepID=UPI003B21AD44
MSSPSLLPGYDDSRVLVTTPFYGAGNNTTSAPVAAESVDAWVLGLELVFGIIGTIGNLLVIIIIIRAKFLHNLTNYLILSLALADMIASMFLIFNVFLYEAGFITIPDNRIAAEIYCRLYASFMFFWICVTTSVFNLVIVTLERFFAIVYPLRYPLYFTKGRARLIVALTWIFSILQELFALWINSYNSEKHQCDYKYPHEAVEIFNGVFIFFISYFLPLLIMIWSYYLIMRNLKRSAGAMMREQSAGENAYSLLRARKRVIHVLLTVVIAFVILWSPNHIVYLFQNFGIYLVDVRSAWYKLTRVMALANSVINPFIYAFKYRQFRKGFRVVICGCVANQVSDHTRATEMSAA